MAPYAEPENELLQEREHSKKVQHHLRRLKQLGIDVSAIAPALPPETEAAASPRFRPGRAHLAYTLDKTLYSIVKQPRGLWPLLYRRRKRFSKQDPVQLVGAAHA